MVRTKPWRQNRNIRNATAKFTAEKLSTRRNWRSYVTNPYSTSSHKSHKLKIMWAQLINLATILSSNGGRHGIDGRRTLWVVAGSPQTLRKPARQAVLHNFSTFVFVRFQTTLPLRPWQCKISHSVLTTGFKHNVLLMTMEMTTDRNKSSRLTL